jgi:F-type H+-transporting ATPase subunit b
MKMRVMAVLLTLMVGLIFVGAAYGAEAHGEEATTWTTKLILFRVVNTLILFAILVYFLKSPLVTYFSERREKIRRELDEVKEQRNLAEKKLKEYEEKIAGMEQELEKMKENLRQAAKADGEKVMASAEQMAEKIKETAKLTAEQELRKAKTMLQNEAVEMAIEVAESLITDKITDQDRKAIVEDYLGKVGGMK